MRTFTLHLQGSTQYERVDNVVSFVAKDQSGSFGIMPGHERMMTSLQTGLARFRMADQSWRFLALPGGLLYFVGNELYISMRRYLLGEDLKKISLALESELVAEEEKLHSVRESLVRLEEEMLKRMWNMQKG